MDKPIAEYDVKRDARKRITLRHSRFEYYRAREFADGTVLLEPRELRVPEALSPRTVDSIYAALHNMDQGVVGDEFDLDEVRDLLEEP